MKSERNDLLEDELLAGISASTKERDIHWHIRCFSSVESTMDVAQSYAAECSHNAPALILADIQTKGRGRHGRQWDSASTGFYSTYIFKSKGDLARLKCLPLVTACTIVEILEELGAKVKVKWPNDILSHEGMKLCGILVEMHREGSELVFLVGVGINLSGSETNNPRAASLQKLTGRLNTPKEIAQKLSSELYSAFLKIETYGFAPYRELWMSKADNLGMPASVHVGNEIVRGIFRGVSEEGHLILECNGTRREISSGELIAGE